MYFSVQDIQLHSQEMFEISDRTHSKSKSKNTQNEQKKKTFRKKNLCGDKIYFFHHHQIHNVSFFWLHPIPNSMLMK